MKKILVASILGIGLSVSQSHAQGYIAFDNYSADNFNGAIITYGAGSGGTVGNGVIAGFTAALYYELGDSSDAVNEASSTSATALVGGGLTLLPATGANSGLNPAYPTPINTTAIAGYFQGPNVTLPTFSSGDVTFEVVAYNGANYAGSTVRGRSGSFIEVQSPGVSGVTTSGGANFFENMPSFAVFTVVPEPTTMALVGLGAAGLLAFRRRK